MCGRHREYLSKPEFEKLGKLDSLQHALGFVGNQHTRLTQTAQVIGDIVVLGVQARARIHQQQHYIGFGHRLTRLFGHFTNNAGLCRRLKTTGIDNDIGMLALLAIAIVAVSGQTGKVRNDGVAAFCQAIEQGRFAHIGPTHQSNNRFHALANCYWGR